MKLYPPFRNWEVEIKNPEAFTDFLRACEDGENDGLTGKKYEKGFRLEKKSKYSNSSRPYIFGLYHYDNSGIKHLTLSIESNKTMLIIMGLMSTIVILMTIAQEKTQVLIAIPVILVWYYLIGWVLYQVEIKFIKGKVKDIIDIANQR